jgi:hypothetical protein
MRIGAIDFWRGAILLVIMIDHVPGNWLEAFTPRNFGLSDSAEAFVFLSGLSVGLAYYRSSISTGIGGVARACAARAFYIYRIHIALTLAAVGIFGIAYWMSGMPGLIEPHGRSFIFAEPQRAFPGIVLLSHQLGYFNILPMYIVLMLLSPAILALARAGIWNALASSLLLYALASMTGFNLPNWPQPGGWFFNPFAWQLMFTLGVCAAIKWREAPLPRFDLALAAALAIILGGAIAVTDFGGLAPGLRDSLYGFVAVQKQQLGIGRVIYFLALAYALSQSAWLRRIAESPGGEDLRRLGRHSLEIFAFGSLLAAIGQAFLPLAGMFGSSAIVESLSMLYTLAGLIGLVLLARFIEWDNTDSGVRRGGAAMRLGASRALAQLLRLAFARSPALPAQPNL